MEHTSWFTQLLISTASSLCPDPNTGWLAGLFTGHLPVWKTNLRKCQRIGIRDRMGSGMDEKKWVSWLKSQGSLESWEETIPHLQIRNKRGVLLVKEAEAEEGHQQEAAYP